MRCGGQQHVGDDIRQLPGFLLVEAALGDPGCAQADAGRVERVDVAGDGVAVDDDAGHVQDAGGVVPGQGCAVGALDGGDIHVEHVAVRAAVGDAEAALLEALGDGQGVLDGLLLQLFEGRRAGELEGQGQGGEDVHVRSALLAGEDGFVDQGGNLGVGGQDDRAARPVEGLVGGGGDDVGIAERGGDDAGGDQSADVGDVCQQVGAGRIRNLAEALPVGNPGVGGVAADDHLRLVLLGECQDGVVVDLLVVRVDGVGDDVEVLAGAVGGGAVGQVPAVEEVHAHDGLAGLDERLVDGVVGGCAGERLHVDEDLFGLDVVGGKGFGAAPVGERFDQVGVFGALVVARVGEAAEGGEALGQVEDLCFRHTLGGFGRVALGVDVLEGGGHGFAHRQGCLALGGDEDQLVVLALRLDLGQFVNFGVKVGKGTAEKEIGHGDTPPVNDRQGMPVFIRRTQIVGREGGEGQVKKSMYGRNKYKWCSGDGQDNPAD